MNGKNLEQVSSFKLLGLTFDDELSFDVHVEKLCTKLSQRIAVLSKIKRCLPHRERIIYYNAMIKSISNTIWINRLDSYIKGKLKQSFKVTEESSSGDFRYGHISTIS